MEKMVSECLDHIGAGIDATGDTLVFLMWELSQAHNAERMARLTRELRKADKLGHHPVDLPYLGAVINESVRLWAPGTLPLQRMVPPGGRVIDGYFVPENTIVGCQSYTLHRFNTEVFPDPEKFLPERWLADDGEADRVRHIFAFGAGPRTCIGR